MRLAPWTGRAEAGRIHREALRVLAETGVRVEHAKLRARFAAGGAHEDVPAQTVRFPATAVETAIAAAPRTPFAEGAAAVGAHVLVADCRYLDPATDAEVPFDETTLARYAALARSLPRVDAIELLGVPFAPAGMPPAVAPLAERLFGWKWGLTPSGSVHDAVLCEPIMEMTRVRAAAQYSGTTS